MNIGIDIDGVLTNLEDFMINYGTKFCIEENIPIQVTEIKYSEIETFNWTDEQSEKFWNKYLAQYVIESKTREFAQEVLKQLQEEGNKIYLITARNEYGLPPEYYGKMQELTKKWLEENNIKYEKLLFVKDEEKLAQCLENKVDMMIEDSPNNIINISKQVPVIKYNCQYNEKIEGKNILTAYSWYHIYDIINKKMKGEN